MNPPVARMYKKYANAPGMKKFEKEGRFLVCMYLSILLTSIVFAVLYSFIKSLLPGTVLYDTLIFALIIYGASSVPEIVGRSIMTSYPGELNKFDFFAAIIGDLVIALALVLML